MKPDFKQDADRLLSGLQWTEENRRRVLLQVKGEPKMKKKFRMAIVLVCALLIVSMAALAVTLIQRSETSSITVVADQALREKYGLTAETIALFDHSIHPAGDAWTVDYLAVGYAPVLLGQYQVIVEDGKATRATWSYDGTDTDLENGDLTSPVWGQKQMEMALRNPSQASAISGPVYENAVPLETPSVELKESEALWNGQLMRPGAPGEEDLTREAALALAKQVLMQDYGLTQDEMNRAVLLADETGETMFYTRDKGNPVWSISYYLVRDGVEWGAGVILDARTGEVLVANLITGGNG